MARLSNVAKLPREILEEIHKLRVQDKFELDEIMEVLRGMPQARHISRSSLGRHVKQTIDQVGERMRRAQAITEAIYSQAKRDGVDKMGVVNNELLQVSVQNALIVAETEVIDEEGNTSKPGLSALDASRLSKALSESARALEIDATRVAKIEAATLKKAAAAVTAASKVAGSGISAATAKAVNDLILGAET